MEVFFARYPPFRYDPQKSPTAEFGRLKATKPRWNIPRDPRFRRAFTQFRIFLNAQNAASGNAVAVYFSQFPEFDYDPRREGLDVNSEFERLAIKRNWPVRGPAYSRNRKLLDVALKSVEENATQQLDAQPSTEAAAGPEPGPEPSSSGTAQDLLGSFFGQFPDFDYNPSSDANSEFTRLATSKGWLVGGKKYWLQVRKFKKARDLAGVHGHRGRPASPTGDSDAAPVRSEDPLTMFFTRFSDFVYDPTQGSPSSEFERLARLKEWDIEGKEYKKYRNLWQAALAEAVTPTSPILVPVVISPSYGDGPLDDFFRSFHNFTHEPSEPSEAEFERLTKDQGWGRHGRPFKKARKQFLLAAQAELDFHLGREDILLPTVAEEKGEVESENVEVPGVSPTEGADDVDALTEMERDRKPWRRLCDVLDLRLPGGRRRPYTLLECQGVLGGVYINIFDFLHHLRLGKGTLKRFQGLKPLADYSYENGRVFPKSVALESPVLKFLLHRLGLFQPSGRPQRARGARAPGRGAKS